MNKKILGGLIGALLALDASAAFDHTHAVWNALLARNVVALHGGTASQVRYARIAAEHETLKSYLQQLEAVTPAQYAGWPRDQRLAFLINAYNAWTVELILTKYPDLKSIKEFGSLLRSPWKKEFIPLLGQTLSLDNIEQDMIRKPGAFDDPRIHFAVNCASIGCPALGSEALVAARLDAQLDQAAEHFLGDHSRNRYDAADDTLHISRIFDWYGKDFEQGHRGITSLRTFFAAHAAQLADSDAARAALRTQTFKIKYTDYDWSLNDAR